MSFGDPTFNRRVTMSRFRACSTCKSRSQATLYHCALQTIANRLEVTFERLRYRLGIMLHPPNTCLIDAAAVFKTYRNSLSIA